MPKSHYQNLLNTAESDFYKNYKYGDPAEAAEQALQLLSRIEMLLDEEVGEIQSLAGDFQAPGIIYSLKCELLDLIKEKIR